MPRVQPVSQPTHEAIGTCSKLAYEIIIVDDASPDGTLEVAKQLQGVYGEDHIVRVAVRPGQRNGS